MSWHFRKTVCVVKLEYFYRTVPAAIRSSRENNMFIVQSSGLRVKLILYRYVSVKLLKICGCRRPEGRGLSRFRSQIGNTKVLVSMQKLYQYEAHSLPIKDIYFLLI
jgi:hypothetical protein